MSFTHSAFAIKAIIAKDVFFVNSKHGKIKKGLIGL